MDIGTEKPLIVIEPVHEPVPGTPAAPEQPPLPSPPPAPVPEPEKVPA